MRAANIAPNIFTYTTLIGAPNTHLAGARNLDLAREIYSHWPGACAKAQQVDRAFGVLKEMEEAGVTPNTATYTSLIDACSKVREVDRAFEVLHMMTHARVLPNTATFTSLIDACGKGNELERAFDVLHYMGRAWPIGEVDPGALHGTRGPPLKVARVDKVLQLHPYLRSFPPPTSPWLELFGEFPPPIWWKVAG